MVRRRRLPTGVQPARPYRARFDRLVARALRQLPPEFARRLENVVVVVADEATPEQLRAAGVPVNGDLYGLYEGVPQPERTASYGMVLPDKITLFRSSIEADCRTELEMVRHVRKTLMHELAHHFGIDDVRLQEIGFD